MNNGWLKMHRSLLDWEWYGDTNVTRLFLHLLLKANHKEKSWQGRTIGAGQLITGRKVLSKETGLSEQQIRSSLDKLKSTGEITIESTSRNSLITLVSWDSHQQNNQELTNGQPTDNQQITTNKNVKNEKNEKKVTQPDGSGNKVPNCPHEEIAGLYMDILPELPRVAKLTDKRKKSLGAAWKSDIKCQSVEFWKNYFEAVRRSDFLMGRSGSWSADFDFVINQNKMIKIIEGAYE